MRNRSLLVLIAALALTGAACSSKKESPPASQSSAGPQLAKVTATDKLKFEPQEVTIKAGDSVEWDNTGTLPHTVTFSAGPAFNEQLAAGAKVTRKFDSPGTFAYKCTVHPPGMIGTVIVQ